MRRSITLAGLLLLLLTLALPVRAAGLREFFTEWGLGTYVNQSYDIDQQDLYSAGLSLELASPLYQQSHIRLDLRLEGQVGL